MTASALVWAVVLVLTWLGCGSQKSEEAETGSKILAAEKMDSVILRIADSDYVNSVFLDYVRITTGEDPEKLTSISLSRLFDDFVDERILFGAARMEGFSLTEEEMQGYMDKLEQDASPAAELEMSESERQTLFNRLLVEKYSLSLITDIQVADDEIGLYYDQNKKEFLRPERVKVSQILLKTEDKAVELRERLKNADQSAFRQAVKEQSVGVEAAKGGEMGTYEMGQLPFEMEKVIFSLPEGQISQVVESSYGYHIFRLDKRYEPELIPQEAAVPAIRARIMDQKIEKAVNDRIQELKQRMVWTAYPQNLTFSYQRNMDE